MKRGRIRASAFNRMIKPLHRWVWGDAHRRAAKLLRFAVTEADGGRDIARAAELTSDPLLRRLYLRHAMDEQRHAGLFRVRGRAIYASLALESGGAAVDTNWLSPGERGLDDLRVDAESEGSLLAFLHLSEKAAARLFSVYHDVLEVDPATREVFDDVLGDEAFHMNYTYAQLKRVSPRNHGWHLWRARLTRLWKGYLRVAAAIANVMGGVFLTLQYFVVLPLFAFLAKRAARKEALITTGWKDARRVGPASLHSQY